MKTSRGAAKPALRATALAAALTMIAAGAAWAQAAPPAAPAPDKPEGADAKGKLQEIVITAERRVANIQKTAISMTAVSGDEIREMGQAELGAVLADAPAVQVQGSPQGGQVFIRGVGANGDSNWVDPAVSINLDGVYSGRAERVFASMFDVARVEILRGPQGTLYGRNATGGSVNVLTNSPGSRFEAGVNAQLGNFDLRHVDAFVNVPLGEMWSARVAAMRETRDGYFSNGGRASDIASGRVKVLFKPNRAFSLLASVDSFDSKGRGATTVPRAYEFLPPPFTPWPTYPAAIGDAWQVDDLHPADVQRTKFTTYSLQADWDMGFGVLTVLPAYTKSQRYTASDIITGTAAGATLPLPGNTWEEDQRTFEVRLASPNRSAIKWVLGAYYLDAKNMQTGAGVSATTGPSTFEPYDTQVPAKSQAVFGQATFPLSQTLRLTSGLRYTRDEKTYHYGIRATPASTRPDYDSGILEVDAEDSAVTYKFGVEADLAPASLVYAQVATGYKAGGFSTTAVPPVTYKPEKLAAFEIGTKNRFLDNRLQVNAEAYYYSYKNYQVQYPVFGGASPIPGDTSGATEFFQYVVNAGKGKNKGLEVETRYRVLDDTELRAALTYTDARYGNFSTPALAYLDGKRVATTPKWTAALGIEQGFSVGGGTLTLGGQTRFSDGYRTTIDQLPGGTVNDYQAKYHKTDLRLGYVPDQGAWTASLWLRNLENKAQVTQALPWARALVTDPRTYGLNVSYRFE